MFATTAGARVHTAFVWLSEPDVKNDNTHGVCLLSFLEMCNFAAAAGSVLERHDVTGRWRHRHHDVISHGSRRVAIGRRS